jgi:hypothetical protein
VLLFLDIVPIDSSISCHRCLSLSIWILGVENPTTQFGYSLRAQWSGIILQALNSIKEFSLWSFFTVFFFFSLTACRHLYASVYHLRIIHPALGVWPLLWFLILSVCESGETPLSDFDVAVLVIKEFVVIGAYWKFDDLLPWGWCSVNFSGWSHGLVSPSDDVTDK